MFALISCGAVIFLNISSSATACAVGLGYKTTLLLHSVTTVLSDAYVNLQLTSVVSKVMRLLITSDALAQY